MINVYEYQVPWNPIKGSYTSMIFVKNIDEVRKRRGNPNSRECVYQVTENSTIAYSIHYDYNGKPDSILQIEAKDKD